MSSDPQWSDLPIPEQARLLTQQGLLATQGGNSHAAHDYFTRSLAHYRALGDRFQTVMTLIYLRFLVGLPDLAKSSDVSETPLLLAQQALPLARSVADKGLLAEALVTFAGDQPDDDVKAMLEESIRLAEAAGERATLAKALEHLATEIFAPKYQHLARRMRIRALALYEDIGDKGGTARVLFTLAIFAEVAQQRIYLTRALELQRQRGDDMRVIECLLMLESTFDRKDLARRESCVREALKLCREIEATFWEAGCLYRLAQLARAAGNITAAGQLEAQSRRIYKGPTIPATGEQAIVQSLAFGDQQEMLRAVKQMLIRT